METTSKSLVKSEARLAYLLLVPSFIILIMIAFYPLGSVFVNSVTNKRFASSQKTEFVGLKNYKKLLGFKVMVLPPVIDDATGKQKFDPETGDAVWESPLDVLPTEPVRYKELSQFSFMGAQYVIGATDPDFLQAVGDTVGFTILSVFIETVLGLAVALVLNSAFKGRGFMRMVMLIPWAIPTAVSSRMWEWMFASNRTGFFNILLDKIGINNGQFAFLVESSSQLWVMIAIDVWKTTPFMALLILAGLQMIPRQIYEAAYVDGANKLRQFWSMTLPMLRATLAVALVFRTLDALRVFDVFQIVFGANRYSMASFAYYQLVDNKLMGYSSASSVVIFLLIFIFDFIYIKMIGGVDSDA
ncbi:carbohydrate ABC transporter permease [Sediminispirochaeta bajacaliforniensis]|uniref:carbohydrate ABC transporter permease n=1 Tax=Sediminispirochaeta bajacaliforniensis TaxID=148 RepID=UPI00037DCBBD|nr:sugar ABC transporter permease [Sediminispirochaeta bajacaliforniensis]